MDLVHRIMHPPPVVSLASRTCRGPRSALAVLRPGLAVSELAVSPLPGAPTAVFTLRAQPGDEQVRLAALNEKLQ
jgi:hypothetical protein